MTALIRSFIEIATMRAGPQVLPSSALLLALVLVASSITEAAVKALIVADPTRLIADVALDILVDCSTLWLLLALVRRRARYPQTLIAVLGFSAFSNLALLPGVLLAGADAAALASIGAIVLWCVMVWTLAVVGNIMRHALEVGPVLGLLVAGAYIVSGLLIYQAVGGT